MIAHEELKQHLPGITKQVPLSKQTMGQCNKITIDSMTLSMYVAYIL